MRFVVLASVARLAVCTGVVFLGVAPAAGEPPAKPVAPTAAPRDVAKILRPIREKADLPAMGGAIVRGDGLVAIGVDGVRKRGATDKVGVGDKWHLGSCTKAMTATLLAMLVEEKKLAWDTTPLDVFPELAASSDAGWKKRDLLALLQHRGGAPENLDADGLWRRLWEFTGTPLEARLLLVKGVLARPPIADARVYSNAGFAIAGAMGERVTKTAWEDLITARLFRPLGMTSAGFGAPGTAGRVDEPRGHRANGTPVEVGPGSDNPVAIGPAGIVHASLEDWGRFASLHLRGAKEKQKLLSRESFERLHTPSPTKEEGADRRFAPGWIVTERPWGGRTVLMHAGSNTMWFCVVWMAPEKDFAVLVTCNQGGADGPCDQAAWALIQDELEARKKAK